MAALDEAITALQSSDHSAQHVHQPRFHQRILSALAKLQRQAEYFDDALETMSHWVALLKRLGDRSEQLRVLGEMGQIKIDQGHLPAAQAHFQRLLAVCRNDDDQQERALASQGLAMVAALNGEHQEAVNHFAKAIATFGINSVNNNTEPKPPNKFEQAQLHCGCGKSLLALGRLREAKDQLRQAVRLIGKQAQRRVEQRWLAEALQALAQCEYGMDQPEKAAECEQLAARLLTTPEESLQTMKWQRTPPATAPQT